MDAVSKLMATIGIPPTFKDLGMPEDKFLAVVKTSAEAAMGDPCTGMNPRKPTAEELIDVYRATYYGK
jgi:alcohol dehydrogenase class IV